MLRYALIEEDNRFCPKTKGIYTSAGDGLCALQEAKDDFLMKILKKHGKAFKVHYYPKNEKDWNLRKAIRTQAVVYVNGKFARQFLLVQLEFSMNEGEEYAAFLRAQRKRYKAELKEYLRGSELLCEKDMSKILDMMQEEDDPEISRFDWMKQCVKTYQEQHTLNGEEFWKKVTVLRTALDDLIAQEPPELDDYSDEGEFYAEIHNMDQALSDFLPKNDCHNHSGDTDNPSDCAIASSSFSGEEETQAD